MSGYTFPVLAPGEQPISLVPEAKKNIAALTPETPVVCMNRGRQELRDTFNGEHYVIPPGPQKFLLEFGAANHFKTRLVQNGTRTLDGNGNRSWICILGVDPAEECVMLDEMTEADIVRRPEGLDRSTLDPSRQSVTVIEAGAARASVPGQAVARASQVFVGTEAVDPASVLTPPEGGSQARADELAALSEGYRPGAQAPEAAAEPEAPPAPAIRGMKNRR